VYRDHKREDCCIGLAACEGWYNKFIGGATGMGEEASAFKEEHDVNGAR
jgi:hypothetical protein